MTVQRKGTVDYPHVQQFKVHEIYTIIYITFHTYM